MNQKIFSVFGAIAPKTEKRLHKSDGGAALFSPSAIALQPIGINLFLRFL